MYASPDGTPRGTGKLTSSVPEQAIGLKLYVIGRKSGSSKKRDAVQDAEGAFVILGSQTTWVMPTGNRAYFKVTREIPASI
jgi:hypothetical protein